MGVSAKELDINTRHINELADQIRYNSDCEVIKLVIEEHLGSIQDLFKDIQDEQKELLAKILPILQLPGPNPVEIVKWISKFVTGLVTPQLQAHIKYTKKLIKLAGAILNVIAAIEEASKSLPQCAIEIKDETLNQIKGEVNNLVNSALQEIEGSQAGLLAIIDAGNTIDKIDTSSPDAFIASVDKAEAAISAAADVYKNET
jgi:hypothetical protein